MIIKNQEKLRVAYISSFLPRECGIATFTSDLVNSINHYDIIENSIVAMNAEGATYDYARKVKFQIDRNNVKSYVDAADWINRSEIDVVNLQHEFGLYGGSMGSYILTLLKRLEKPVATTLHTVLPDPSDEMRDIVEEIAQYSTSLIVINKTAENILRQIYGIPGRIVVIPHGAPEIPFLRTDSEKEALGLEGRIVLSTFGLLGASKGIEYAINALPDIVRKHPEVLYLVIGETHPEVRRNEGESYRNKLMNLVENLNLENNVRFSNRFLTKRELINHLKATDIYVAPYINRDQISSGTLVYGVVAGKAVVSTPFLHAQELLSNGRGIFCRFKDPSSISDSVNMLIENDTLRKEMRRKAHAFGRSFAWARVGKQYIECFLDLTTRRNHYQPEDSFPSMKTISTIELDETVDQNI